MPWPCSDGQLLRQPRQTFGLAGQADRLQGQRGPIQVAARDLELRTEHGSKVLHHTVVRRCRGGQQPHVRRQRLDDPLQQAVVRAEVVAPVGNAMCLVDDQHRDLCGDAGQNLRAEALVRQTLGRDQENVDLSLGQLGLDLLSSRRRCRS